MPFAQDKKGRSADGRSGLSCLVSVVVSRLETNPAGLD